MPHRSWDNEHAVTTNTWQEEATPCQNATTVRFPLPWGRIYHFNVIYNHAKTSLSRTADTELALSITCWLVERLGVKGLVNSYYHDRDNRPQNSLATELDRVLNGSGLTILVLTQGFLKNCWPQYTHLKPFRRLVEDPESRHHLLVVNVGVCLGELPPDLRQHDMVELQECWRNDVITWARIDRSVDTMLQYEKSRADCLTTIPSESTTSKEPIRLISPLDHKMEDIFSENNEILQDRSHASFRNERLQMEVSPEVGPNSSIRNHRDHECIAETLWDNVIEPVKSRLERKIEHPYLVLSNEYLDYLLECERDFNAPATHGTYDLEKESTKSQVASNEELRYRETRTVYENKTETQEAATETWQNMLNLHAQGACNCFKKRSENSRYRSRLTLPSFRSRRKTTFSRSRVSSTRPRSSDRIRWGVRNFSELSHRPVLRKREFSSLPRTPNYCSTLANRSTLDTQIRTTRRCRSYDTTDCCWQHTDSLALSYQNRLSREEEFDRHCYHSHLSFAERERARMDLLNNPSETHFLKTEDNNTASHLRLHNQRFLSGDTSDVYNFDVDFRAEIRDSEREVCLWEDRAHERFGIETGMRYTHENDDRFDHLDHESRTIWSESIDFLHNQYRNALNDTISAQIARERAASPVTFDFSLRSDFCCAERELEKLQAKEEENCLRLYSVSPGISTFDEVTTDNAMSQTVPSTRDSEEFLGSLEEKRDESQQIISNLRERVWKAATQTPVKANRDNSDITPLSVIEPFRNHELVTARDVIPFDAHTNTHECTQTDSYELYTDKEEECSQLPSESASSFTQISCNIVQDNLANSSTVRESEKTETNPEAKSSGNVKGHEVEADLFHQENILAALLATELLKMEERETIEKYGQNSSGDSSWDDKELSSKRMAPDTSRKRVTFREERNQVEIKPLSPVQAVSQNKPSRSVNENQLNVSEEKLEKERDIQRLSISDDMTKDRTVDKKVTNDSAEFKQSKSTKVSTEKQCTNTSNGSSRKRKVSTESRLRGMNIVSLGIAKEILQSQIQKRERWLALETTPGKNSSKTPSKNISGVQDEPKTASAKDFSYGENIPAVKIFNASIGSDKNTEKSSADKNESEAVKCEIISVSTIKNIDTVEKIDFNSSESPLTTETVPHPQPKEYAAQQSAITEEAASDGETMKRTVSEENIDETHTAVTFYSLSSCKDSLLNTEESRVEYSITERTITQEMRTACAEEMTVKEEYTPYCEETAYEIHEENLDKNIVASNISNDLLLERSSVYTTGTVRNEAVHEQSTIASTSVVSNEMHAVDESCDAVKTESQPSTDNTDSVSIKQAGDSSSDEEVTSKTETFIIYNSGTCEKVDSLSTSVPRDEKTEKKSTLIFQYDTSKSNRDVESVRSESRLNIVAQDISEDIGVNERSKLSSERYAKEDVHATDFSETVDTRQGLKETAATCSLDEKLYLSELGAEQSVVAETIVAETVVALTKIEDRPLEMQVIKSTENTELITNTEEMHLQSIRNDSVQGVKTEEFCEKRSKTDEQSPQEKNDATGKEPVNKESTQNDNETNSASALSSERYAVDKSHHDVKTESQQGADITEKHRDSSSDEEITSSIERYIIYNSGACEKVDSALTLPQNSQIETGPLNKYDFKKPRNDIEDIGDSVKTVRSGLSLNVVSQNISEEILTHGQPKTLTEYVRSVEGVDQTNSSRVVTQNKKESMKTYSAAQTPREGNETMNNNGEASGNNVFEESGCRWPKMSSYSENLVAASLAYDISRQHNSFETNRNGTLFLQRSTNYLASSAMPAKISKDELQPGSSHSKESLVGESSDSQLAQGIKRERLQIVDSSQKPDALGIKANIVASTICEEIQLSLQSKNEVKTLEEHAELQLSRTTDDTTNKYERIPRTSNVVYSVSVTVPKQEKEDEQSLCQSINNLGNLNTETAKKTSVTTDEESKREQERIDVSEQDNDRKENENTQQSQKVQEIIELQKDLKTDAPIQPDAERKVMDASGSENQCEETSEEDTELLDIYETIRCSYRRDQHLETDADSCAFAEGEAGNMSESEMASPEMESVISFTERGQTNVKLQSRAVPEIMTSPGSSGVILASGNEGNDEVAEGPCGERKRQPKNEEDGNEGDWLVPVYRGMCHVMSRPEMPYLG